MQRTAQFTGHRGPVYALVHGPEAGSFLSGSGDGLVVQWQVGKPDAGQVIVQVGQAVFSLYLLHAEGLLLIGTEGGGLHVVDLASRRELHLLEVHRKGIFRILPLPDARVACAAGDGTLSIWRMQRGQAPELLRHIPLAEEKLRDLSLAPDAQQLAVACGDGSIHVLDTALFNELHTLQAHPMSKPIAAEAGSTGTTALAYHPTKSVLLSAGKDGHLRAWRSDRDHALLQDLPIHKAGIYQLAFSGNGGNVASASRDKTAKLWNAQSLEPAGRADRAIGGHTHSVNALLWIGEFLLTASDDRSIIAWKP